MKHRKNIYKILITKGLFLLCSWAIWGQSPFHPSLVSEAFLIRDHLEVFTDRSLYVADESVQFRADYKVEGLSADIPWSSVLYVELITTSGNSVARGKYPLYDGWGAGSLHIPSGILTGNYLLKCYTRWMRNLGPQTFSYYPLKIINPFHSDVVLPGNGNGAGHTLTRQRYHTGYMECRIPKTHYEKGEEVVGELFLPQSARLDQLQCCITVVPKGGIDTLQGQFAGTGVSRNSGEYRVQYLPDLHGTTLSGTMIQADQGGHPVPHALLYFSLLDEKPDYYTAITDAQGRFMITAPDRKGVQEWFVTPDPTENPGVEIRIDQDFDPGYNLFPLGRFALSETESQLATGMAIRMQLASAYHPAPDGITSSRDSAATGMFQFYGTPVNSLIMDDYINLPTLEEVFINLIPEVFVVSRRGTSTLKLEGPDRSVETLQPLILIDNIPVFDHEVVMGISPEKILKIDVINEIYVKGNVFHGGLISIISRKGDMAGIDLPEGSYFFDFQAYHPPDLDDEPLYDETDRVPDTRNTIYWMDQLPVNQGSGSSFSFHAPANPGEYRILVRGVNPGGGVLAAVAGFTVK